MSELFLFARYPELARLDRLPLGVYPTPATQLIRAGQVMGLSNLWIKRDDLTNPVYGGNKVRKLEFILGEARRKEKKRLVTIGPIGSHHVLATAIFGQQEDFRVTAVQFKRPVTPDTLKSLRACFATGADMHCSPSRAQLPANGIFRYIESYLKDRSSLPYFVQPGGSSSIGDIGYVNAAFELAAQVAAGELPEPAYIFVPLGTCGTYAGLLLGCRLAGLNSKIVGVRVVDKIIANKPAILQQMIFTLDKLRALSPDLPKNPPGMDDIHILHSQFGEEYGTSTSETEKAIQVMKDREGLELEETYSGKAFAGLLEFSKQRNVGSSPILFWYTLNSSPIDHLADLCPDYRELPRDFHAFFEKI